MKGKEDVLGEIDQMTSTEELKPVAWILHQR